MARSLTQRVPTQSPRAAVFDELNNAMSVEDDGSLILSSNSSADKDDDTPGSIQIRRTIENQATKKKKSTSTTISYEMTSDYASGWTKKAGFREYLQNWQDGIVKSFGFSARRFTATVKEQEREILIEAWHPDRQNCLVGYISFRWDKNEEGVLELVNFNSSLTRQNFKIGGTTKANDDNQAGTHGEGLKIGALAMMRGSSPYRVVIESSGSRWSFFFQKPRGGDQHDVEFKCRITTYNEDKFEEGKKISTGKPRVAHKYHMWEDVCVRIGGESSMTGSDGLKTKGKKVSLAEIRDWISIGFYTNTRISPIRTNEGDLILEASTFHLLNIELASGSASGKPSIYGYNFARGDVDRDRRSIQDPRQEARQITAIWSGVLGNPSHKSELIGKYAQLIRYELNQVADVMLYARRDNTYLDKHVTKMTWEYMRKMDPDKEGLLPFYYNPSDGQNLSDIIRRNLGRRPVPVSPELWRVLRTFKPCRSPLEEQKHRFAHAQSVAVPHEMFALHIEWMLQCILQADLSTSSMTMEFIDGQDLGVDVVYSDQHFKIDAKWISYEGAHRTRNFCDESPPTEKKPFTCDHVIRKLWGLMVAQMMASSDDTNIARLEDWYREMAEHRLSSMPRAIICTDTDRGGELHVSWQSVESHHKRAHPMRVLLHSLYCTLVESQVDPRYDRIYKNDKASGCHCDSLPSTVESAGVTFKGLDPRQEYLPKVCRDVEGAFFGLAPAGAKPAPYDTDSFPAMYDQNEQQRTSVQLQSSTNSEMNLNVNNQDDTNDAAANTMQSNSDDSDADKLASHEYGSVLSSSSPIPTKISTGFATYQSQNYNNSSGKARATSPTYSGRKYESSTIPRPAIIIADSQSQSSWESYVLGEYVTLDRLGLNANETFQEKYDPYHALNEPPVLIAKPKLTSPNENGKRTADGTEALSASKKGKH